MSVWLCAATEFEMQAAHNLPNQLPRLVHGVGIPLTLCRLFSEFGAGKHQQKIPTAMVQIGIAGVFAGSSVQINDVVDVCTDRYADLGLEIPRDQNGSPFRPLSINDGSKGEENSFRALATGYPEVFANCSIDWTDASDGKIKKAHGLSVQSCTGTEETAKKWGDTYIKQSHEAYIESMEGAALAHFCYCHQIPWIQIRAISNIVGHRNITIQSIRSALLSLEHFLSAMQWEKLCQQL